MKFGFIKSKRARAAYAFLSAAVVVPAIVVPVYWGIQARVDEDRVEPGGGQSITHCLGALSHENNRGGLSETLRQACTYLNSGDVRQLVGRGHDDSLAGAGLSGAYLGNAKLFGVDLSGSDISGSVLRGANLAYSNLSDANLQNADLTRTTLTKANLANADLRNAGGLTIEQLSQAQNITGIKLPEYIDRDALQERHAHETVSKSYLTCKRLSPLPEKC